MKRFIAVGILVLGLFLVPIAGQAKDGKTQKKEVPNTVASPELLGPHYFWKFGDNREEEKKPEGNSAVDKLVDEKVITPAAADAIKERNAK